MDGYIHTYSRGQNGCFFSEEESRNSHFPLPKRDNHPHRRCPCKHARIHTQDRESRRHISRHRVAYLERATDTLVGIEVTPVLEHLSPRSSRLF